MSETEEQARILHKVFLANKLSHKLKEPVQDDGQVVHKPPGIPKMHQLRIYNQI